MELTILESAQSLYSDFHKDVHGFRPRHASEEQWNSLEWLYEQIAHLESLVPQVKADEEAASRAAIERFEESVRRAIMAGAKSREQAIAWLRDAEDDDHKRHDDGYFEYCNGLPYGYLSGNYHLSSWS